MNIKNKKIAMLLAIVITLTVCLTSITCFIMAFNSRDKVYFAVDKDGKDLEGGKTYNMPGNVIFTNDVSNLATAEEGINLKATVRPSYADNVALDWSIKFINSLSEWATGKVVSEYVTFTKINNDTVNIKCLLPFGEKIKIEVVSVSNPDAKAECVFDYRKRLDNYDIKFTSSLDDSKFFIVKNGSTNNELTFSNLDKLISYDYDSDFHKMSLVPNLSIGTTGDVIDIKFSAIGNIGVLRKYTDELGLNPVDCSGMDIDLSERSGDKIAFGTWLSFYELFEGITPFNFENDLNPSAGDTFKAKDELDYLKSFTAGKEDVLFMFFLIDSIPQGKGYAKFFTAYFSINPQSYNIGVSDVVLDDTTIVI